MYCGEPGDLPPNTITSEECEIPDCGECGSNAVEILTMPQRTSWFGGEGKIRCQACGATAPLSLQELDEEGNVIPWRPSDALGRNGKWFGR